jgi:tetratricopeptide (TPR) repeat protein
MWRSLTWCLMLGTAATALTLGTGGALAPFAAALLGTLAGGAAGNFAHEVCKVLDRRVFGKLIEGRAGIAENHVVVQALRLAELKALRTVLQRFDAAPAGQRDPARREEAARFSRELARWLDAQEKPAAILAFARDEAVTPQEQTLRQAVLDALPESFDAGLAARRMAGDTVAIAESFGQMRRMVETAVLAELRLTLLAPDEDLPPPFPALFAGSAGGDGWFDLFIRGAADRIKQPGGEDDGGFARVWTAEQLAIIKAIGDAHTAMLRGIKGDTEQLLAGQESAEAASERRHREVLEAFARKEGVAPEVLAPLFDHLGESGLTLDEIRQRAPEAIEAILTRARQPVERSNDGADIDATIAAARAKLARLDTAGTIALLTEKIAEEKDARRQRLIPLLEEQAAVQRLSYEHDGAKATLRELLALDPERLWAWIDLGDLLMTAGTLDEANTAYGESLRIAGHRERTDPGNAAWQRDLSVSHNRIGDVRVAQGDLTAALHSFQAALAIRDRLAKTDPENAAWQRDLSVSQNKIGDVRVAQGDLTAALHSFQAALAIRDRLAKADPGNAAWQRDLSVSHNRIGDVRVAQGDLTAALLSFQADLAIAERLANADPGNAAWQRDLSISHNKIGDVRVAQGDLTAALHSFQAGLAIAERLAKADPGNAEWQRDLSISHERIGDVRVAQGDLTAALHSFQAALAIRDRLAKADPGNAAWQRDLSVSHDRIGDVRVAQGDLTAALLSFQAALAIRDPLAKADPGNAAWQRDLSISHNNIGDVRVAQGDLPAALHSFQASHAIFERLAKADPGNAAWQRDLSISHERIGDIHARRGETGPAIAAFERALRGYRELQRRNPGDVPSHVYSVVPLWQLGSLKGKGGRADLQAALAILQMLADADRLDARRRGWIAMIQREITSLDA